MNKAILRASAISKKYDTLEVLKSVDLAVLEREIVSITGASGAGKSTLLHILGTLDLPDSGELLIDGVDIVNLKKDSLANFRNKKVGFVFQFHNLLPEFSAIENVCLPGFIGGKSFDIVESKAKELLDLLGLKDRIKHKPSELSGGEQQRVAVARALINDPKVIFADEPSGNLDSANSKALHDLFFQLREELQKTFVIVTHNEELAEMSDRKVVIRDGTIASV